MPAWNLEIIGTYAQTEMGHGNKSGNLPARTYYYTKALDCIGFVHYRAKYFSDFVEIYAGAFREKGKYQRDRLTKIMVPNCMTPMRHIHLWSHT